MERWAPDDGAWPMPMHGPQADSRMRAPDSIRSPSAPERAIIVYTWREPGVTPNDRSGCTVFPLSTAPFAGPSNFAASRSPAARGISYPVL